MWRRKFTCLSNKPTSCTIALLSYELHSIGTTLVAACDRFFSTERESLMEQTEDPPNDLTEWSLSCFAWSNSSRTQSNFRICMTSVGSFINERIFHLRFFFSLRLPFHLGLRTIRPLSKAELYIHSLVRNVVVELTNVLANSRWMILSSQWTNPGEKGLSRCSSLMTALLSTDGSHNTSRTATIFFQAAEI